MSKATDKNPKIVNGDVDPMEPVDGADAETKDPGEAAASVPEKKGMSTGKKVGIGVAAVTFITALVVGIVKLFGGGDDVDVIDTTGSVE